MCDGDSAYSFWDALRAARTMGDSWEDWDDDNATPVIPGVASATQEANTKFAGEDEEEEAPKWQAQVPKPQAVRHMAGWGAVVALPAVHEGVAAHVDSF